MQALERDGASLPLTKGRVKKREFNYIRHGTQSLIAGIQVATGEVYGQIGQTRTEEDFVDFIDYIVKEEDSSLQYIFIVDQLNIHKSEALVRWLAHMNKDTSPLGVKGKYGILKDMNSRMEYLSRKTDRIRFVFTPKHCSWLNLIEVWFSQLSKRVLQFGNFISQDDLAEKVLNYLDYYNRFLAKSFKWSAIKKKQTKTMLQKIKKYIAKLKN